MAFQDLIERLLGFPDAQAQKQFLAEHTSLLNDKVADALKAQADHFLRTDIQRSLQVADLLIYQAELTKNPLHRALGLLARANAHSIGLGEYQRAMELYNEAATIYEMHGHLVDQAKSQIGKLWALASLGCYEEVMETGEWALRILEDHGQWLLAAKLIGNMGIIQGRIGEDVEALKLFDKAREMYYAHGAEVGDIAGAEYNRAIVLRNLGQLEDSIRASQAAIQMIGQTDEQIRAARAKQSLAVTYLILGRYNEALTLLEEVKEAFLADGRRRHALLAELFISDCMLQSRRYTDVLEKCREVRETFNELGTRLEVAQAILNEAVAYASLNRHKEAQSSLAEARRLFQSEGNPVWVATSDLEQANILYHEAKFEQSLTIASGCAGVFKAHDLPYRKAFADVVAARAATALGQDDLALRLVNEALTTGESQDIPTLTYQSHHILGRLARSHSDLTAALTEYDLAIEELERLQGRLMVEFRADFLEDKQVVYEEAVDICLDMDRPHEGLEYAERAKSRALLDLLAYRLNLSIQPRKATDGPVVEELTRLCARRNQMYRRWESDEAIMESGWIPTRSGQRQVQQDILAVEKQITGLWHKLLVHNADYAREATLWHVRTEPIQPYLSIHSLLLEYFTIHGRLVVFLVTGEKVQARRIPCDLSQIQRLIQLLRLNLELVPKSEPSQRANLTVNSQRILRQLYQLLIAPVSDELSACQQLVVVPHGPLHYLPFHALYDGKHYLLERHEISYLPGSSILRHCREARPDSSGLVAVGNSSNGRLPYAVQEAEEIASTMGGQALLEDQATLSQFCKVATDNRVIHVASHGDFRADNPLFSSLALADGWLTTLDIFNLRLNASLVTLSGCQTGRSVIGGGDELLGLMRAFLYAGAASLVISLWTIEDRSTARLMKAFYRHLAAGHTKAAALREAQLQFLQPEGKNCNATDSYHHPYFWAPFSLVGDSGSL
ncbi:MAG: CHAT domain-containing protein [Anaerolineae bacterium]